MFENFSFSASFFCFLLLFLFSSWRQMWKFSMKMILKFATETWSRKSCKDRMKMQNECKSSHDSILFYPHTQQPSPTLPLELLFQFIQIADEHKLDSDAKIAIFWMLEMEVYWGKIDTDDDEMFSFRSITKHKMMGSR